MSLSKAQKLAVTGEIFFLQLSQEEDFLWTIEKNPYFIILWFWPFKSFSKLKATLCKYGICVYKEYEVKIKMV